MEENKKKVSSREAWRLHRRAAKLFYAERPALHAVNWLYAAFKSLSPYVLIYLSAQIIGELTGTRDAHRLTVLAVAAVAAASLLPLITAALERWPFSSRAPKRWARQMPKPPVKPCTKQRTK